MIPRSTPACNDSSWQQELATAFTDPKELLNYLRLAPDLLASATAAAGQFSLRVPRCFAALMEKGNPEDPLLRQVLPLAAELQDVPGFAIDPVGDLMASRSQGLIHKYQGRVLLIASPACAVHCRYCFRRHFSYRQHSGLTQLRAAIQEIESDNEISEVILSGGDPLSLADERLQTLVNMVAGLPQVRRLRIHSRLPIVLPSRVTPYLLELLGKSRLQVVIVVHANHPFELSHAVGQNLIRLASSGITVLNQSVLLKGVNDRAQTLAALSERLFELGVLPYYLHILDRVSGAAHFEVDEASTLSIHAQLRDSLPGYLVPRLVREVSGARAKMPVF